MKQRQLQRRETDRKQADDEGQQQVASLASAVTTSTSVGSSLKSSRRSTLSSGWLIPSAKQNVAANSARGRKTVARIDFGIARRLVVSSRSADHGAAAMAVDVAPLAVARFQRLRLGKLRFSFTQ